MKKLFLSLIASLMLVSNALAIDFTLMNKTNETFIYWFYRMDHNIKDYFGPFNYAGGELKSGEILELKDRKGKVHEIIVQEKNGRRTHFAFDAIANKVIMMIKDTNKR